MLFYSTSDMKFPQHAGAAYTAVSLNLDTVSLSLSAYDCIEFVKAPNGEKMLPHIKFTCPHKKCLDYRL